MSKEQSHPHQVLRLMLRALGACFTAAVFCMTMVGPSHALAASRTGTIQMTASVGYSGYYDTNHLVPIFVSLRNSGHATTATLYVSADRAAIGGGRYLDGDVAYPVVLPGGATTTKEIAIPGNLIGHATLQCVSNGVTVTSLPVSGNLLGQVALVAVVSNDAQATQFLTGSSAGVGGDPVMAERIYPNLVPRTAGMFDNLTAVCATPQMLQALSSQQLRALSTWVSLGGLLMVTGTSPTDHMARLSFPMKLAKPKKVPSDPLVTFEGDSAQSLSGSVTVNGSLADKNAVVLAGTADTPVIAAVQSGRGWIVQTAFSPTQLLSWPGNVGLWTKVIDTGLHAAQPVFPHFFGADGVFTLANASDALSPLRVPSLRFWGSVFLLYALAIGPVLFYFLRVFRKEPTGWLVLPVISIVTTIAIYGFGISQRPNTLLSEGIGVLELTGDGQAASYGITGFTSPFVTRATASASGVQFAMAMFGTPVGPAGDAQTTIEQSANVQFTHVPRWGVRYVYTAGTVGVQGSVVTHLNGTFGILSGEVVNETPYPLNHAAVLWHGQIYELGDLNPGDTAWIDSQTKTDSFKGNWLPTYGRYNGDITHGLGRVLGSYLAEQPTAGLQDEQAVFLSTTTANTPSTVDLSIAPHKVSSQTLVFVRQFLQVDTSSMPTPAHPPELYGLSGQGVTS